MESTKHCKKFRWSRLKIVWTTLGWERRNAWIHLTISEAPSISQWTHGHQHTRHIQWIQDSLFRSARIVVIHPWPSSSLKKLRVRSLITRSFRKPCFVKDVVSVRMIPSSFSDTRISCTKALKCTLTISWRLPAKPVAILAVRNRCVLLKAVLKSLANSLKLLAKSSNLTKTFAKSSHLSLRSK